MHDTTTHMIGCSATTLTCSAGAFLSERFCTTAGHFASTFSRRCARTSLGELPFDDLIEEVALYLCRENHIGNLYRPDLFATQIINRERSHRSSSSGLQFNVNAGGQIQLHQGIQRLWRWLQDVE
jgi:hypothetical protein